MARLARQVAGADALASLVKSSLFRADFDETDLAVFDRPFAYVPFEDAAAKHFCDFVRRRAHAGGDDGQLPEVKAAFLTTCLFEAAAGRRGHGGRRHRRRRRRRAVAKDTPPSRPTRCSSRRPRAIAASDDLTDDVRRALTTALDALERAWAEMEKEAAKGEEAAEAAADAVSP